MIDGSRNAPEIHAAMPKAATVTSTATDPLASPLIVSTHLPSLARACSHNDST